MVEYFINLIMNYWFWGFTGFLAGGVLATRNMFKNGCSFPLAIIALTAGIYAGLLGTRILYVLIFYPRLFVDDFWLAIAFWQETGTWLGGPLLGPLGMWIVLRVAKKPFWSNLGSVAPAYALAHIIARIGCLVNGCCYGTPSDVPWAVFSDRLNCMVHPTQIYSMIGEAFSLVILQWLWGKPEKRVCLFPLYCLFLAAHRFISEFFRGADSGLLLIPGLRVFQVVCVLIFILSLCVLLILKWKKRGAVAAVCLLLLSLLAGTGIRNMMFKAVSEKTVNQIPYLVVTRSVFSEALNEWAGFREKEGYRVVVRAWETTPDREDVKGWIESRQRMFQEPIGNILIVGDCGHGNDMQAPWHMPSFASGKYTSDAQYGDMDNDGLPDVPVGRLAIQSTAELDAQIKKIISYSKQYAGPAQKKVLVWFGAQGYTAQMSRMAPRLLERLPDWIVPVVIGADSQAVSSGELKAQPFTFLARLNSNRPFLSLIVSHGSYRSVTAGTYDGEEIFLSVEDVSKMSLNSPAGNSPPGVLFMLGCDSGRYCLPKSSGPSLGEAFLAQPNGPVGVVSATGTTHPLTNYLFVKGIIMHLQKTTDTIGQAFLGIQQALYDTGDQSFNEIAGNDPLARSLLNAVPENEKASLGTPGMLRNDLFLYNLLGDPACRFFPYK